jgi:hypothetical protein
MSARSEARRLAEELGVEYIDDQTWHRSVPASERFGSIEAYTPAGVAWWGNRVPHPRDRGPAGRTVRLGLRTGPDRCPAACAWPHLAPMGPS